ncbi:MAG: nucleotide exchange factor GrpE [Bacteroidota bacterium]
MMGEETKNKETKEDQPRASTPEEIAANAPGDPDPELLEAKKLAETYRDQLLRKAAEFENYKRRTDQDFSNLVRNANENFLLLLLPVLDDMERSLKHGKNQSDPDSFYRGIELIRNKLGTLMESQGLAPFDSVGKPFDVEYHDALMQVPNGEHPKNTVVEEVERGYTLNGKVLRHSKVIVSSGAEQPEQDDRAAGTQETEEANG